MQRIEDDAYSQYIFLYEHIHISHYIVYILQEDELMIPQQSNGDSFVTCGTCGSLAVH